MLDVTSNFAVSGGKGWREMVLTGQCVPDNANSLTITSEGPISLSLSGITRSQLPQGTDCSF